MRTAAEYAERLRFETNFSEPFEDFCRRLYIEIDTIFEVYTLWGDIVYVRVTDCIENLLFDVKQCQPNGELVYRGLSAGSCNKSEIARLLYEGDWRVVAAAPLSPRLQAFFTNNNN